MFMSRSIIANLIDLGVQSPELRPHLRPLLAALKVAQAQTLTLQGGQRKDYAKQVYDMVVSTYTKIGVPIKAPSDLMKYQIWRLYLDPSTGSFPIALAFVVYKQTPFGLKLGLGGSNGSPEGKAIVIQQTQKMFFEQGVYGEVSHALEKIALSAGAPKVPAQVAAMILGDDIQIDEDGFHYTRKISGLPQPVRKIMLGNPNVHIFKQGCDSLFEARDATFDLAAHLSCLLDY